MVAVMRLEVSPPNNWTAPVFALGGKFNSLDDP